MRLPGVKRDRERLDREWMHAFFVLKRDLKKAALLKLYDKYSLAVTAGYQLDLGRNP